MAFFDSIPPPEPPPPAPRQPEWIEPDAAEMPASLGIDITLAVSEKAAVYLSRPVAYRNGLKFDLVMVHRDGELTDPRALQRFGFHGGLRPHGPDIPADYLRFGVELDGGVRLTNLGSLPLRDPGPGGQPVAVLLPRGGGGHDGCYRQEWWLWPLPRSGDVALVCQWPAFDIAESRATLSGDAIREAATRARALWPTSPQ